MLLALATASCDRSHRIQDLACGPFKLRLVQTRHTRSFAGGPFWSESILLSRPSGWVELVSIAHRHYENGASGGPETFSRLLPPAAAFRSFPPSTGAKPAGPGWTLYVDPSIVSRAEYDALASCLETSAAAIEHAFAGGPMDRDHSDAMKSDHMRITATLYARHEVGFIFCGEKTLGTRWDCADHQAYIKTVVDQEQGQLVLCRIDPPGGPGPGQGSGMMTVGRISSDQTSVFLRAPSSYDSKTVLHGKEPRAYYATCRDPSGKGFFDTFSVGLDGSSSGGAVGRAQALFNAGQYEQALAGYREALRQEPNAAVSYQAGRCLDKLGRKKEALEAYRKAVELAPANADFHYEVATHLLDLKKYKEALEHYRRITVLEPTVAGGYINLGMALNAAGRYEEALKADREALRLKPDALAYYNVGIALHNAGRPKEAIEAYSKAVELSPGYADARHELAGELLAAGHTEEAGEHYQALARLEPGTARGLISQGMVLHGSGRCSEAVAAFEKADRLCRDCFEPGEMAAYQDCYNRTHR